MRGKIVCALFAVGCCAFGQGLLRCKESPSRPAVPEAARQACAKIPEEHREAVGSEIRKMAYTEATREAGEKFGLLIVPKDWTNTCGKGVLLGSYMEYYKYAPDGRLVQYGNRTNFEELVWCDRRRDELVVQFWNDRAIVDAALSNVVASAKRAAVSAVPGRSSLAGLRARRAQKEAEREEEAKRKVRDERMVFLPKYRVAFKALTGYEMGQKIGEEMLGREREWKSVKLAKPYRYFTDCTLEVCDGCLYRVSMSFRSDGKYSWKSLEAEAEAVRKDLAGRFGMEEEEILERTSPVLRRAGLRRAGWRLAVSVGIEGAIWLSISDDVLAGELRTRLKEKREAQREAQKEALPVFEEAGRK